MSLPDATPILGSRRHDRGRLVPSLVGTLEHSGSPGAEQSDQRGPDRLWPPEPADHTVVSGPRRCPDAGRLRRQQKRHRLLLPRSGPRSRHGPTMGQRTLRQKNGARIIPRLRRLRRFPRPAEAAGYRRRLDCRARSLACPDRHCGHAGRKRRLLRKAVGKNDPPKPNDGRRGTKIPTGFPNGSPVPLQSERAASV